ncbi:DUF2087 domain-containing protein [Paenibacillus sp. GXUN7292]|uniref:DUF2087 domain-containing protein n=1 Tax=Paenibacillus sp. GXUN7292 TaxID=3422499 RepID=UPI003D7D5D23
MQLDEMFWSASLEQLKQGYVFEEDTNCYRCLLCGETFEDGEVFLLPQLNKFYEARKYVAHHIKEAHGSVLQTLLGMDKKATGLTELQKELIEQFAAGQTDAQIVKSYGKGSASTIRNHRFVLKEKAKQARLLLAIIELMEASTVSAPKFVPIHRTATQVDERYALTEEEYGDVLKQYFPSGLNGPLTNFPRKEKRKVAILRHISSFFERGAFYSEADVNEKLKPFSEQDYVTLRRYLIEYGFLDREDDGSKYWIKS